MLTSFLLNSGLQPLAYNQIRAVLNIQTNSVIASVILFFLQQLHKQDLNIDFETAAL